MNEWNTDDNLYDKIINLENRIKDLERENIETTNTLYEILNTLETIQWHSQNR